MRIDLDEHYTIVLDRWGYPCLIKHKTGAVEKNGKLPGKCLYFQTYGQVVKSYIKMQAVNADIHSFSEMAAFIDGKLKAAELAIDQQMRSYGNEK